MGRLSVDFPHLLGNAPGMVHSPEIHLLSGEWDMSTLPETSTPAYAVQGVIGSAAGYSTLTPNPTLTGPVLASYAVSRDGISVAGGIDTRWAELVAHNTAPSDTLLYRGHAFINTSATPGDFFTLLRGGYPTNRVWGAYVYYSDTGFDSFQIVDSNVGVAISGTFTTPVSPGDSLFTGINYASHRLVHQHNAEPVQQGALLNLLGMPDDETFYEIVFLVFATEVVVLGAGSVSFLCGSSTGGRLPIQGSGEAVPPAGATDGREYKVTVGGSYGSYRTLPGDFAKFYNAMQDLQITRLASRFSTPAYTVRDIAYDQDSDTFTLELSDGTRLETSIPVPPGVDTMTFDGGTHELTTVFSDGSEIVVVIPASVVTGLEYTAASGELRLTQDGGADVVANIPPGVESLAFEGSTLTLALSTGTELTATIPAVEGFVAITDIQPTSPADNVFNKSVSDDGYVLQSCESSTSLITVYVVAVTGKNSFRPGVTVNGVPVVNLVRNSGSDTWSGSAAITLSGGTVTVVHSEGATDSATVAVSAPPTVTSASFSGLYPNPGQTEHAAGQTFTLNVTADQAFVALEVVDDGGTATTAVTGPDFPAVLSKAVTVSAANRGTSPQAFFGKVRVKNQNGTWSAVTLTANTVVLNNLRPTASFGAVTYDNGFSALKGSETASVAFSWGNADTVAFTSPTAELQITGDTVLETPKVASRIAGGYNIATSNLSATVSRTANATTFQAVKVVNIADTPAQVHVANTLPARLQSGPVGNVPAYPVTLSSTQRLLTGANAPSLLASIGTWSGSAWATSDSGLTWTRSLAISDSDAKGAGLFSGLVCRNLAGVVTNVLSSGDSYIVGGFVRRVVSFSAGASISREAPIGTSVVTASLVRATNLSKGVSGTFNVSYNPSPVLVDDPLAGPFTFSITGPSGTVNPTGDLVYNNDSINAANNINPLAPIQFEIEEVVS